MIENYMIRCMQLRETVTCSKIKLFLMWVVAQEFCRCLLQEQVPERYTLLNAGNKQSRNNSQEHCAVTFINDSR